MTPGVEKSTCGPGKHPSLGNMWEEDGASVACVSLSSDASGESPGDGLQESRKLPGTPGWSRKPLTLLAFEDFLEEVASQEHFKLWEGHGFSNGHS